MVLLGPLVPLLHLKPQKTSSKRTQSPSLVLYGEGSLLLIPTALLGHEQRCQFGEGTEAQSSVEPAVLSTPSRPISPSWLPALLLG